MTAEPAALQQPDRGRGASPKASKKRVWWHLLKLLLGLSAIAYLVSVHRQELVQVLERPVRWHWLALGASTFACGIVSSFLRWYWLLLAQAVELPLRRVLRIAFVGYFLNLLMPSTVGGDVAKAVMVGRSPARRVAALSTIFMDRYLGLVGLMVLGGLTFVLTIPGRAVSDELRILGGWVVGLLVASLLGGAVLLWPRLYRTGLVQRLVSLPKVGPILHDAREAMIGYSRRPRLLVGCTLWSCLGHFLIIQGLWWIGLSVWESPTALGAHFLATPIAFMISTVPLTPGGLGVTEATLGSLYGYVGELPANALVAMLCFRLAQVSLAVFGGLLYLAGREQETHPARSPTPERSTLEV